MRKILKLKKCLEGNLERIIRIILTNKIIERFSIQTEDLNYFVIDQQELSPFHNKRLLEIILINVLQDINSTVTF